MTPTDAEREAIEWLEREVSKYDEILTAFANSISPEPVHEHHPIREHVGRVRTLLALATEAIASRDTIAGLRGFKRSVDEALNSGDGTYRP